MYTNLVTDDKGVEVVLKKMSELSLLTNKMIRPEIRLFLDFSE